jgi:hypothetical protein
MRPVFAATTARDEDFRSKGCELMHTFLRHSAILAAVVLSLAAATSTLFAADSDADANVAAKAPASNAKLPGPKYSLRYQFHAGDEIRTEVDNMATVETTISGATATTEMVSLSHKLWRIHSVDKNGNVSFEHLIESVDMRNQMTGRQQIRYNSLTDKTAPPGYEDVAKSLGKPLTIATIDPWGAVLKREEKQHTNSDNSGSVLITPLPKEPAAIGYIWYLPGTVMVQLDGGGYKPILHRQRYELKKVEDGLATISVETQILSPVSNPKLRAQLIQRMWQGSLQFDINQGRMLSHRTDLDERVLGFHGPDSSMHYVARFAEKFVSDAPKVASAAAASEGPAIRSASTADAPKDGELHSVKK